MNDNDIFVVASTGVLPEYWVVEGALEPPEGDFGGVPNHHSQPRARGANHALVQISVSVVFVVGLILYGSKGVYYYIFIYYT